MKFYSKNLKNLILNFNQFAVIVLHGKKDVSLLNDFHKLIEEIGGPNASEEMRLTRFLDSEIKEKADDILVKIESRGFFKGPNLLTINDLTEKNEKIILDIEKMWQPKDTLTLVCIEKLSKKSKLKLLAETNSRVAYLRYFDEPLDKKQLLALLQEKRLTVKNDGTLKLLNDFIQNFPRDTLLDTLEKLSLLKLNENSPIDIDDFKSSACLGYETDDLEFASAIAGKQINKIYKSLMLIHNSGKKPQNILQFLSSYFRKLYFIEIYGEVSFNVKREFPFLFGKDMLAAKKYAKNWGEKNLQKIMNFLTIAELDLRKRDAAYEYMLFVNYVFKVGRN